MDIITDRALILHSIKHGDSSLILHAFARNHGRLSIIAKGARSKKPRFGASLEVMTHTEIIYSFRPTRDIQMLREARVIDGFLPIRDNLEKTALGLAVCELLRMVTPNEEASLEIFDISLQTLEAISRSTKNTRNHFWRFELELFHPLGIGLSLTQCQTCGKELSLLEGKNIEFDSSNGNFRCSNCALGSGFTLSMEAFRVLEFLNRPINHSIEKLRISPRAEAEIKAALSRHLRTHLPIHRDLKSLDALKW
jgi:DNA repair protein RecO (recombination protein O)